MSKLYYVQVIFVCTTQPNALKGYDAPRYICEKSPTYPRYILLTHQLKRIYSKMDQQYINMLHAPKLDIWL